MHAKAKIWRSWSVGYVYQNESEEHTAKFTVQARSAGEAARKAEPLMIGRGVAWRVYPQEKETSSV